MALSIISQELLAYQLDISYNTTDVASGILFASATSNPVRPPSGAKLLIGQIVIDTAFNAGSSNLARVGWSNGGSEHGINLNLNQASGTIIPLVGLSGIRPLTAARDLWFRYYPNGTAATAGRCHVNMIFSLPGLRE